MCTAQYLRGLRAHARAAGKCQQCRARPAKPGCVTCQHCLDWLACKQDERRAEGLCRCGREPRPGRKTCERCAAQKRTAQARREKRRLEAGLCVRCQKPTRDGKWHCHPCAVKHAARMRTHNAV